MIRIGIYCLLVLKFIKKKKQYFLMIAKIQFVYEKNDKFERFKK
jgi:hypothetical protein